jgi:hypothetical protein
MSQPEISRRCLSCGASVRAGARFCPQCGAAMKDGAHASAVENRPEDLPGREPAPEAPSRREVASAFENWREEARQTTTPASAPAGDGGRDGVEASPSRPTVGEPARRAESAMESAGGAAASSSSAFASSAARREGVDEGIAGANVAASPGGAGVEASRRRGAGAVVKENIMPRVERMREEALVVLEETPDDAGLRFVAAAVVLFLLFLLLLFLSTVLK